jgi:hypothetical protein
MKALPAILGAASILALLAFGASGAAAEDSSTTEAKTFLHFVERASSDAVTNGDAEAAKVGNVLTFANPVYDAENDKVVASDMGYCVYLVKGKKSWECTWTTFVKGGSLTVEGPYSETHDTTLAITGGTGAYRGATGEMALHARNNHGTAYDFIFHIALAN